MSSNEIKKFLPLVRKPARYIGNEINSVKKDITKVSLTFGFAFPDVYEIGMSHLGLQILYQILNSREDIACERVFAPWTDMEALLRSKGMRLSTLESGIELKDLGVIGFSLQYELSYTNIVNMLDLGGVPLYSRDRGGDDTFVIAGGPLASNPEPVADFFDAILLGDGEEAVLMMADAVIAGRANGEGRTEILKRLAAIEGVYVPSFFDVEYNADGTVSRIVPLLPGYTQVVRRVVPDVNGLPLPVKPVVPFVETVHDRVSVEISRGCTRGCRFCQAGVIYRPIRERNPDTILSIISGSLENTGYDEVSLLSLSTGDYTHLEKLLTGVMARYSGANIAVSLPSVRVGTLSTTIASEILKVRKTGFTMAPEAGSERLRTVINKGIREEDLLANAKDVFSLGWKLMKLYFMIGLPTETDVDIEEIVRVASLVRAVGKANSPDRKAAQINVSVASFIPKPHTPFQWEPQLGYEECIRRQGILKKRLASCGLGYKWHDANMSIVEGVFARGDRRLSKVIVAAFDKGCRFDGWSEKFNSALWTESLKENGIDAAFYNERRRPFTEVFPWDHLSPGVTKEFLMRERERALSQLVTADCKTEACSACGVCDHKVVKNVVAKAVEEPKGGKAGSPAPQSVRMRLGYCKTGEMRFLGHLEFINAVTRAFRRADLKLKYSEGFHPLPKIAFSTTLPVGVESIDEQMDIELDVTNGRRTPEAVVLSLNGVSPVGLRFLNAVLLPLKIAFPSVIMTEYCADMKNGPAGFDIEPEDIDGILRDFLQRDSITLRIEKEGRVENIDIRPMISSITRADTTIRFALVKSGGKGVRPHDLLSSLFNLSKEDASLIPILKTKAYHQ